MTYGAKHAAGQGLGMPSGQPPPQPAAATSRAYSSSARAPGHDDRYVYSSTHYAYPQTAYATSGGAAKAGGYGERAPPPPPHPWSHDYQQQQQQQQQHAVWAPYREGSAHAGDGGGAAAGDEPSLEAAVAGVAVGDERKFKDPVFAALFILQFVAVVVVVPAVTWGNSSNIVRTIEWPQALPMFAVSFGIGAVFAVLWYLFVRAAPKVALWFGLLTPLAYLVALTVVFFVRGTWAAAVVFLVLSALYGVYVYFAARLINFAAVMLKLAIRAIEERPTTVFVSLGGVVGQLCLLVLFIVVGAGVQFTRVFWLWVLVVFWFFWSVNVNLSTVHTAICGVVATWYFYPQGGVPNPTTRSLKRASVYSFGSVCLGALLTAIVQALRAILRAAQSQSGGGGLVGVCILLAQCFMGCIEWLLRIFNKYAFCYVALYGKSYVGSAKKAFKLFEDRGMHAIINEDITTDALLLGSLFSAAVCMLSTAFWANSTFPGDTGTVVYVVMVSGAIGFTIAMIATQAFDSAVTALYVCFAEDDMERLYASNGAMYAEINRNWHERYGWCFAQRKGRPYAE